MQEINTDDDDIFNFWENWFALKKIFCIFLVAESLPGYFDILDRAEVALNEIEWKRALYIHRMDKKAKKVTPVRFEVEPYRIVPPLTSALTQWTRINGVDEGASPVHPIYLGS